MKPISLTINQLKQALANEQPEMVSSIQADNGKLIEYLSASNTPIKLPFSQAGVLIPLVRSNGDWQVILTRRAAHLKHHPGEIAFPGGRFEETDRDLSETATRETFEEIGIDKQQIQILGQLPAQQTVSQYQVAPFVAVIDPDYQLTLDPQEVESAFTAPLNFLLNPKNQQRKQRKANGQTYWYYEIKYNEYIIWGATAKMLVNLGKILSPFYSN